MQIVACGGLNNKIMGGGGGGLGGGGVVIKGGGGSGQLKKTLDTPLPVACATPAVKWLIRLCHQPANFSIVGSLKSSTLAYPTIDVTPTRDTTVAVAAPSYTSEPSTNSSTVDAST